MEQTNLYPLEINTLLSGEKPDFIEKAKRKFDSKAALALFVFGFFWTAGSGVMTAVVVDNKPVLAPILVVGLFLLIGVAVLTGAIYVRFAPGPWFIGTPKRLITYRKNKTLQSTDWDSFNNNIEVSGGDEIGTITLEMTSGRYVSRKNRSDEYVPNSITMAGIPHAISIAEMCRERIEENTQHEKSSGQVEPSTVS